MPFPHRPLPFLCPHRPTLEPSCEDRPIADKLSWIPCLLTPAFLLMHTPGGGSDGSVGLGSCPLPWETWVEFWLPASPQPGPRHCRHVESQSVGDNSVALPVKQIRTETKESTSVVSRAWFLWLLDFARALPCLTGSPGWAHSSCLRHQ